MKTVRLTNRSHSKVEFAGGEIIPPLGSLVLDYTRFLSVAKENELDGDSLAIEFDSGAVDVSVDDFGAVGNGATDDTVAFQSAVDFVLGLGGGVVRIPVGIYVVSGVDISGGYAMLAGNSMDNSVLKLSGNGPAVSMSAATGGMSDLQIVGSGSGSAGVSVGGASMVTMTRCSIKNVGTAIEVSGSTKCNANGCSISAVTYYSVGGNGTINEQFCVYGG